MSLSRYENREVIVQLNEPQYGQLFTTDDLRVLPHLHLIPEDVDVVSFNISQVHIYSFFGDYIVGDHRAGYIIRDVSTNSLLINIAETFREANIRRGSYIIAVNVFRELFGNPDSKSVYIREVSPDRTELKLSVPTSLLASGELQKFKSNVEMLAANNVLNNLVIDFGFNRVAKVVLVKFDSLDSGTLYVKLYRPLFDDVGDKESGWFGFEVVDPYLDTVILASPIVVSKTTQLRGANYDIDTSQLSSNATVFKTWDDLLDSDLPTSQRIIDSALSGSASARLNIDYTDFSNFVFYSSAEERLRNFKYKLQLIESYNDSILTLQESTASNTPYISSSISLNRRRVDQITTTMDHFERWLYYSDTGSIFTYDVSGSLTPWPKYINDGRYILHHTTSSIAVEWFDRNIVSASAYDEQNYNRLWWSIPEHVVMDAGNSDYVTFVEMVAQHFDNLYMYVKALTDIHVRDEHPERGPSNDLLYPIAKSFGWNLQNSSQTSDLWLYKLGMSSDGKYSNTGSLFSVSRENHTHQVWRRIVNNLPYLLKTKGTERSVKAMMSIYGIPQTLLSIKEYGGPTIEADRPSLIEDRFNYALNFDGTNYIKMPRVIIPASSGSWGGVNRVPDTVEFRFKTSYSSSVSMSLWSIEGNFSPNRNVSDIELVHVKADTGNYVYSGSTQYGYLRFWTTNFTNSSSFVTTSYLPLFDGEFWTVQFFTTYPISGSSTGEFNLRVGAAHDCYVGKLFQTASVKFSAPSGCAVYWGANTASQSFRYVVGGSTGSHYVGGPASHRFVGQMQGYKEYFEVLNQRTFESHVLNPGAYHGNNVTSSYYTLYKYYPMGLDQQRWDHSVYTQVSSSQPNRLAYYQTTASFYNFTGSQSEQYTSGRETYFVQPPSLGGNTFRSKKLRVESSTLSSDLSPVARHERSQFDNESYDTNRLAVVFAPNDHVNRDIADHMGGVYLDNWIADPEYEFSDEYSELKRFSEQYWKKYQKKNDINSLIRILSVYDYSFFEQIKQLIPGRADYIGGILIEPNVLERSKVRLSRRPVVENPQYERDIVYVTRQSGEYLAYDGSLTSSMDMQMSYVYNTASIDIQNSRELSVSYTYMTSSIGDPVEIVAESVHHTEPAQQRSGLTGTLDIYPNRYSGSQCETGSMVALQRIEHNCKYYRVIYHYSASGNFTDRYLRQWYTAVSMSYKWYYSRSLDVSGYQIDECSSRNNSRYRGCKLTSAAVNVDSPDTVDGGPVITIIESNPNVLFAGGQTGAGNLFVD